MSYSKKWVYLPILFLNDLLVVYATYRLAYFVRFQYEPFLAVFPVLKGTPEWGDYALALRVIAPLWVLVLGLWGRLYHTEFPDAANEFLALVKSAVLATLLTISATFMYRSYEYSRLVMALGFFTSIAFLFCSRLFWKWALGSFLSWLVPTHPVLLIGEGKSVETLAKLIGKDPHKTVESLGAKDLDQALARIGRKPPVEVYLSGQLLHVDNQKLQDFLDRCEDLDIEIKVIPDLLEMSLGEITVDESLGVPILHLKPLSLHGSRFLVKRLFDVTLSIVILTALFIPFSLIALFIVLESRGGVFFIQERVGFRENRFKCFKFRTMRADAEKVLEEMKLESFRGGPAFKMKDDPRITRVGKWLRKFSFDEFPQIWNILRGEMSFIGPRPQVLAEAKGNAEWARRRYRILPGITGLWQVSGRADLTYEDMMRLDIYYLENWSPGLDLKIVLKTLPVVAFSKGAY